MHDVAYFKEENSGRTITVCRDTTAAALIGLRAMLLFKARHEWACEWVKSKGNSRLDEVAELNPKLGLWTRGSCYRDPTSGEVVIGRLNKKEDNCTDKTVSMSELYTAAGWSMPCQYIPGMRKAMLNKSEMKKDGGSLANPGHHATAECLAARE